MLHVEERAWSPHSPRGGQVAPTFLRTGWPLLQCRAWRLALDACLQYASCIDQGISGSLCATFTCGTGSPSTCCRTCNRCLLALSNGADGGRGGGGGGGPACC